MCQYAQRILVGFTPDFSSENPHFVEYSSIPVEKISGLCLRLDLCDQYVNGTIVICFLIRLTDREVNAYEK